MLTTCSPITASCPLRRVLGIAFILLALFFHSGCAHKEEVTLAKPAASSDLTPTELLARAKGMLDSDAPNYDPAAAFTLLEKASDAGLLDARLELATCKSLGLGTKRDYPAAVVMIRSLASSGHLDSQYKLAHELIYNGLSDNRSLLKQDTSSPSDIEGVSWLRRASISGHVKAQASLAVCYVNGIGVKRNPYEAFRWARLAAVNGSASAQFTLGCIYANGEGVRQDLMSSYVWLMIGRSNPDAGYTANLHDHSISQIRRHLDPEELAECERRIADTLSLMRSKSTSNTSGK